MPVTADTVHTLYVHYLTYASNKQDIAKSLDSKELTTYHIGRLHIHSVTETTHLHDESNMVKMGIIIQGGPKKPDHF